MDVSHWYKFDDTDVSDCKMDDDEELRTQCFGGDYSTQNFDQPVMKRFVHLPFASSLLSTNVSCLDNVDGGMHTYYSMKRSRQIKRIPPIV